MTSSIHNPSMLDGARASGGRAGASMPVNRLRAAAAAVVREAWEVVHAASTMRSELRRMADECESTRPDQAARLRKLAKSNWDE